MNELAAAKLNEHMAKMGITPVYNLIDTKIIGHINEFVMRVECSIVHNGPVYAAEGFGRSKKEAKHEAAHTFIKMYLGDTMNNNPSTGILKMDNLFTCAVRVTENNRNSLLQSICLKYNHPKPVFREVGSTGPPHAKRFTLECRVSHFTTEGKGSTKAEAKMQATTKMIQLLMQEAEVDEIFESSRSMVIANKKIICLTDNLRVSHSSVPICVFGRRRSSSLISGVSSTSDTSSLLAEVHITTASPTRLIAMPNNGKKVDSAAESSDNSAASNLSLIEFHDDFQQKTEVMNKNRSKSMTDLLDYANTKPSNKLLEQLSCSHTISKINQTLEKVEKELYDEILGTLENPDLPRRRPVVVLHHEFEVFINHGDKPKIFEGGRECTDASIRIAALTKLLTDMRDYTANSRAMLNI